jgi:hypothetical protein
MGRVDLFDVSPDGRYMLYRGRDYRLDRRTAGTSWWAVSKAPFLTAMILHMQRTRYCFSGCFVDNQEYVLKANSCETIGSVKGLSCTLRRENPKSDSSPSDGYFFRGGWRYVESVVTRPGKTQQGVPVYEKELAKGWTLRKFIRGDHPLRNRRQFGIEPHELVHRSREQRFEFKDWEWGDFLDGRLVWTVDGCLWTCDFDPKGGPGPRRLIHDFRGMKFESIKAPYPGVSV